VSRIDDVARLHGQGLTGREIAKCLGVKPPTVSYYLRKLGVPPQPQGRYDWAAVQEFYDRGHSISDCEAEFGMARATLADAAKRGDLRTRPAALPLDKLLAAGTPRGRHNVKLRLLSSGLKTARCEICGITEWRGAPLSFSLHHVNGDRHDNRLENLQLLCGNCHSQTENFGVRNRRARAAEDVA
jgi:transcriptional regulator with XRE-family HTH domain